MSSDDWERLEALFEEALALPISERDAMLRRIADGDPELAARLAAMLARAGDDAGMFIDRDVGTAARRLLGDGSFVLPPEIGPYRVVRLLGEGGMGVVYLAERNDVGGFVALKLLRDAWLGPSRRERFRAEQRTLAQLRHPGIAQLHDAGSLPDGIPWFAMEYVEGQPITDYCKARSCTIAERLRLFRAVAEAVQHAHSHAVIHRDLKPSNVLVTHDGAVKLLDFGIAKQLDHSTAPDAQTLTGLRMLTPAYAAPEQFEGGSIGVHTDVFTLGVLLYELLTGRRPFESGRDDIGTLAHRAREVTRPSVAAAAAGPPPGRATWPELDVIVQKAMHPEIGRRYRTADALIRDLDRYERGEPLEARPDTVGYRAGRFVRRNWRSVTLAGATLAAIVGVSAYYTIRLARARDQAIAEATRTSRIQRFMLSLFEGGDAEVGPADTLSVRALIDRGVHEASALDAEPIIQAELYATLGALHQQRGELGVADSLLQLALNAQRRINGQSHPDVAATLAALARLRVDQARLDDAERLGRDAAAMADRHVAPADPRAVEAHAVLGLVFQEQSRWPEAITEQRSVLRRLAGRGNVDLERARAMVHLANSYFYQGELAASDSLNRFALAAYRRLRGENHPLVADALINLGAAEFERGRYVEAEQQYREALTRTRAWYGDDHPATAAALTMLGRALNFQKRDAEATAVLTQALAVQERVHGAVHPAVASALNDLANIALRNDRLDEAEERWRRVESIYLSVHGERHWLLGIARSNLGSVMMSRKNFAAAESYYRQAIRLFEQSQGVRHLNTGIGHIKLGRSLLRQSRWREAVIESRAGYDLLTALPEAPKGFLDAARTDLAAAYEQLGDHARAAEFGGP